MCNHRILIFFAQILHGTLEYGSTQTVEVQEGSEKKGGLERPTVCGYVCHNVVSK